MADTEGKTGAKPEKESFWHGVRTEFGKIIWPDRSSLLKQTVLVMVISIILGVIITVIDSGALKLFQLIIG